MNASNLARKLADFTDEQLDALSWANLEDISGRSRQLLTYRVKVAGMTRRQAMLAPDLRRRRPIA